MGSKASLVLVSVFSSVLPNLLAANAAAQPYGNTQPYGTTPPSNPPSSAQPQPNAGDFQSGGLAPPPPMDGNPGQQPAGYQTETERQLTEAEEQDAGRGLEWIYFNVEGGYEHLGLETFKSDGLTYANTVATTDSGPMLGAGVGIRLIFVTIGGRARVGMFDQWNVATLDAELGIHLPLGDVEPYFTFSGGYAFLGSMDTGRWGGDVSIRGWDARTGFGLNYYVTPSFSIGGNLTAEALFLSRPGVDLSAAATGSGTAGQNPQLDTASQQAAEADGSSIGGAVTGSALLGLHF